MVFRVVKPSRAGAVLPIGRAGPAAMATLHRRVIEGDADAVNLLAEQMLKELRRTLRGKFPRAAPADIITAIEDAILDYARRPDGFDAGRGISLRRFLLKAGDRNLQDLIRSERRRRNAEAAYMNFLALQAHRRPRARLQRGPGLDVLLSVLASCVPDASERGAFLDWLAGESTSTIADRLGVLQDSAAERRHAVKCFTDRIIKRMRRRLVDPAYRQERSVKKDTQLSRFQRSRGE